MSESVRFVLTAAAWAVFCAWLVYRELRERPRQEAPHD